jgi:hypothetical protein
MAAARSALQAAQAAKDRPLTALCLLLIADLLSGRCVRLGCITAEIDCS